MWPILAELVPLLAGHRPSAEFCSVMVVVRIFFDLLVSTLEMRSYKFTVESFITVGVTSAGSRMLKRED